ncbi:glutamate--cysteine ligase [Alkaliphilus transvaalensis]|uniref:glutamate--cysteine ligase n=1 Tax=Alkaliphilus transvaalensis TaxID=114628 RepID=UPI000551D2D3|nr:glutamate-cysteine ligase family protein [Alkaliphilus transvaalensis]
MVEENKIDKIVSILRKGEKRQGEEAIGVEFEHIIVDAETYQSMNFYEEKGIEHILKQLQHKGYSLIKEANYLVGLEKEEGVITLEPGGQFELSTPATKELRRVEELYIKFLVDLIPILDDQNQKLLALGYHPKTTIKEIPFNPKKRYEYMSNYLKEKGTHAHNMMKGTAAIQVAIDYISEEDFIKKFRVANFLSPILAMISDNSPIFEGEVYHQNSIRSVIWENTDKERSGIVKGVMDKSFGYREYAQYILDVPPILYIKDGNYLPTYEKLTSQIMEDSDLTDLEIEHLLTMVFPDVRAKRYIEIRMGDSLPYPLNLAFVALIKGLFYHSANLNTLYNRSLSITDEELNNYKNQMIEKGFNAEFQGSDLHSVCKELFLLAEKGLDYEEKAFLAPLKEIINQRKNPAIISKELIKSKGLEGLEWTALNHIIRRGHDAGKEII